ncbi:hypothetical protein L5G28_08530 [Gordonia sp. HY285]|uniref:hypothetical protein n=1 Tax=Gordonia liuliyuniae TaxID=2911517 RepID=UPI001F1DE52F|nr:hypothetical protein [Gordonia liuliyuniae]MCF8610203.1 hypothetical protein [Gordonia liuliyuniae]
MTDDTSWVGPVVGVLAEAEDAIVEAQGMPAGVRARLDDVIDRLNRGADEADPHT